MRQYILTSPSRQLRAPKNLLYKILFHSSALRSIMGIYQARDEHSCHSRQSRVFPFLAVPLTSVNGSKPHIPYDCGYKGLNAVPQAMPISTCQRLGHRTSCSTNILASVALVSLVLEVIVL